MRSRVFALFTATVLLMNTVALASSDTRPGTSKKRQSNALVALLPASDGVATFDAQRFFNAAMPQVLAKNPTLLTSVTSQLTDIEQKTGIDLRKFDSVAVGLNITKADAKKFSIDPVAIARGATKAGTLLSAAKTGSNGTYKEEKYGERTIYIFSAKDAVNKASTTANGAKVAAVVGGTFGSIASEVAVAALDDNTLALGSTARVRETLDAKTQVSPEITSLLSPNGSSIMTFALRAPNGMSAFLPLENDELGKNVDSIQFVSGTMDVAGTGAAIQLNAKTVKAEQAKSLYDTLDGLKMLGKAFLGGSKRPDQQMYARLIENAKLGVRGNVVSLDLQIPQSDIDTLIGSIK